MGALPDREPPVGAPRRRPESAPPLSVVPGAGRPATDPVPAASTPAPVPPQPAPSAPTTADTEPVSEETGGGLDLDKVAALRTWAAEHLRPPDLVNEATPGLKQLWEQALKGDHLPENRVLRAAEVARLVLSLPVIAASVLLAWSCVSAARQAALALALGALYLLGSTLLSAAKELL